jgi:restriction system protein
MARIRPSQCDSNGGTLSATKGVFVATSYFTAGARDHAQKVTRRIFLIDGDELAALLIRHNIGARVEETLFLKKIDEDFFLEK